MDTVPHVHPDKDRRNETDIRTRRHKTIVLRLFALEALREFLDPGKEVAALHVGAEDLGDDKTLCSGEILDIQSDGSRDETHIGSLVVLDETAEGALGGAEGAIQHMHVDFTSLVALLQTAANLQSSALCIQRRTVIRTIVAYETNVTSHSR